MPPDEHLSDALKWLRYAEADLALAGVPLPEKGMYELLSFHAQQAVEKAFKAILISRGIDFPKTHSIEYLLRLVRSDITRVPVLMQVYKLTGYATIFRYPGDEEQITVEIYQELLMIARDTLTWVATVLNDSEI